MLVLCYTAATRVRQMIYMPQGIATRPSHFEDHAFPTSSERHISTFTIHNCILCCQQIQDNGSLHTVIGSQRTTCVLHALTALCWSLSAISDHYVTFFWHFLDSSQSSDTQRSLLTDNFWRTLSPHFSPNLHSMSQFPSPDQIIDVRIDQGPKKGKHYSSCDLNLYGPVEVDDHCYPPPQPAQDQTSQRLSHYSDTSVALFTLYLRFTEGHVRRKYELLKGELDSIIVFVSHCVGYYHATSLLTRNL
jgi:hypothetical protein